MAAITLHDQDKREAWEAEDADRRWAHYQKCEGTTRRHKRAMRVMADEPLPEPSTLDDMRRAIDAQAKTLATMKDTARRLPAGRDRWAAIRLCLDAGMRQSEVARLFGVSRARVTQMLAEDDCPFR